MRPNHGPSRETNREAGRGTGRRPGSGHSRRHRGDYVRYRFLPVGRPEMLPEPQIATTLPDGRGSIDLDKSIAHDQAMLDWFEREKNYHPWIWGGHRISGSLRAALERREQRIVTYLPEAPQINAIGTLSEERIAGEWRSNPVFAIVAICVGLMFLVAIARRSIASHPRPQDAFGE